MTTNYSYGYTLLSLYLIEVIKKLGTREALQMLESASTEQGVLIAKRYEKNLPKTLHPIEKGAEIFKAFMTETGADIKIHKKTEDSYTFLINKCPFNELYLEIGIDCGYFLNGLCSNLVLPSIRATLMQIDKNLEIEPVITRESAEDFCLIKLTKND
ncbi:L-2-amino-thiazoline-4-carboxylic acid hydrolase [Candidatus Bathyarchaeota archaeon]|nr:L-2-amino-thiazoline-4-carboxylic acid hydrolase [Candidatus Bathyarchaeota archaeon]